jgi:hypothetical protein
MGSPGTVNQEGTVLPDDDDMDMMDGWYDDDDLSVYSQVVVKKAKRLFTQRLMTAMASGSSSMSPTKPPRGAFAHLKHPWYGDRSNTGFFGDQTKPNHISSPSHTHTWVRTQQNITQHVPPWDDHSNCTPCPTLSLQY